MKQSASFPTAVLSMIVIVLLSLAVQAGNQQLHIATILWRGETEAEHGLKDGLEGMGYRVDYAVFNAGQDLEQLGKLLGSVEQRLKEFDYIYTFGTTVSRRSRVIIKDRIPQIFNVVTDPVGAGIVKSYEASGGNICGISDNVPVDKQIDVAQQIFSVDTLGVMFNPREKNSMFARAELYKLAKENGMNIVDLRSPPEKNTLQENLDKLAKKQIIVDAIYLPPDSYLLSEAETIGTQLKEANIKSIGAAKTFVEHGALMGLVVEYYDLGLSAAQIIDRHQKGIPLGDMTIERIPRTRLVVNKETSEKMKIVLPANLKKAAVFID